MDLTWDTTISIEGAATALAVMGAALGYIINLVQNSRLTRKENRVRGTKLALLHFLEKDPWNGMKEDDIFSMYHSPDSASVRSLYKALKPRRLKRIDLERHLKALQWEGQIDLCGVDTYTLRFNSSRWTREDHQDRLVAERLRSKLPPDLLQQVAKRLLGDGSQSSFTRGRAIELLLRHGRPEDLDEILASLHAENQETALEVAEILAKHMNKA